MPYNKLALLRYKIIDQCLQNRYRKWTLEDLMAAVSEGLYEYEGIRSGVSKRTIQLDLQNMRSDKLGYHAPIIVLEKKYYTYEDKNFTLAKANLSRQDLESLGDIVRLLQQFKGFHYFEDMSTVIGKLEDKILRQSKQQTPLIDLEKNELLAGLEWIEPLLEALKRKKALEISYQSFKAKQPTAGIYHPYLLKEYRNRWFLLCRPDKKAGIQILALDRIQSVNTASSVPYRDPEGFSPDTFFEDVIGVTKTLGQATSRVILSFDPQGAPYVKTKPLHGSQQILRESETDLIISLDVILNFELEREILGFGEQVTVLAPKLLRNRIRRRLELSRSAYDKKQDDRSG